MPEQGNLGFASEAPDRLTTEKATDEENWFYFRKHNPFVSHRSTNTNSSRLAKIQNFNDFEVDVKTNALPQVAFLAPDMIHDGNNTTLEAAMKWSLSFLQLLESSKFMNGTCLLLTYDESERYGKPNHIQAIMLGGAVPEHLKGTNDSTFYKHYSWTATIENNWGLPNLGRYDVGANVSQFVAEQTGYVNVELANLATVHNSLSYSGYLHRDKKMWKPIPPPEPSVDGSGWPRRARVDQTNVGSSRRECESV